MSSPRAPLFSVGLAFACGCLLGLDELVTLRVALVAIAVAALLWFFMARRETVSLAAFYFLVACAGLTHTLLLSRSIPADDLRRLPDEKEFATSQWRGQIIEEPTDQLPAHASRRTQDRTTFGLQVEAWRPTGGRLFGADIDAPWRPAEGEVQCTIIGAASGLQLGDRIEFATALAPVAPPLTPGGLDYREYEALRGVYYEATLVTPNWRRIEAGGGDWWQDLSYRARDWAYARLQIGLEDDPRTADFLAGMLIGYRKEIPADIEEDFRRTGTLHVFAVSGQNISEMVLVAVVLLQLCGLVRWRWAWLTAPFVLLYCLLTGSPASAVRATVMALTVLLAWRLGRPLNALGCWSLAFLAMLMWSPSVLLDPGAQLSFGIVLGLILLAPPLYRLLARPFQPDPFLPRKLLTPAQQVEARSWQWMAAVLGTGIAATVTTEPITALDFHQVTPISIFANFIVVPVAGWITCIGTLSVAVSAVNTVLAAWLNNSNWVLARFLIWFVAVLAHRPGASLNVPDLSLLAPGRPAFVVAPAQDSTCLLVQTPEQTWLVDAGRETAAPATVWHLLQFYGVNRLDGLVLAQMSAPDNGGAAAIIRDFHPRHLVVPVLQTKSPFEKQMPELAVLSGHEIEKWKEGDTISLGSGVSAEILHPAADDAETHADDRALVLLFHVGGQTLLWAGRISAPAQREVLAAQPGLHADVLVMGTQPQDEAWLKTLQVRDWLQMPAHDRGENTVDAATVPDFCQVWPLTETGSVEIRPDTAHRWIVLRPWTALPH